MLRNFPNIYMYIHAVVLNEMPHEHAMMTSQDVNSEGVAEEMPSQ